MASSLNCGGYGGLVGGTRTTPFRESPSHNLQVSTQPYQAHTDGLAGYPKAAIHLFRKPLRTGRVGRPRLILAEGVMSAQAIKSYAKRRVVGVIRRVVIGADEVVAARLRATQGGSQTAVINTAYIERLQATFRSRLGALVRRSRGAVRLRETLAAGMWLVGSCYNLCWTHKSMRREREGNDPPGGK
jgi:hypothetical protein